MDPGFQAKTLNAFENVSLYSEVLKDSPGRIAYDLIGNITPVSGTNLKNLSAELFSELANRVEVSAGPPVGNLWQNYLLDKIITADNPFTRMASGDLLGPGHGPGEIIKTAAAADLKLLRIIMDIDFSNITPIYTGDCLHLGLISRALPETGPPAGDTPQSQIYALKNTLLTTRDWTGSVDPLAGFYRRCGYGLFCRYHALRWDGSSRKLTGIPDPDPIRLDSLVGYEEERGRVIQNTERLLSGLPAGNMLLYGDRGTGKSSTVKALLHRYGARGLRMIELPKPFLSDYQQLITSLKGPALKFIIFMDELTFGEREEEYKALKSILDGSLQVSPQNVAIYATSNRRHLVREYFDERRPEVGRNDTLQEKLSLSDRFGITLLFLSPDQELYLKIAEQLARQKGIDLPTQQLRLLALEWERYHNSRSGRTARQFIDQLVG